MEVPMPRHGRNVSGHGSLERLTEQPGRGRYHFIVQWPGLLPPPLLDLVRCWITYLHGLEILDADEAIPPVGLRHIQQELRALGLELLIPHQGFIACMDTHHADSRVFDARLELSRVAGCVGSGDIVKSGRRLTYCREVRPNGGRSSRGGFVTRHRRVRRRTCYIR